MLYDTRDTVKWKFHRDLNITQKIDWNLAHHIREVLGDNPPDADPFLGSVETDEAYFGDGEGLLPSAVSNFVRAVFPNLVTQKPGRNREKILCGFSDESLRFLWRNFFS